MNILLLSYIMNAYYVKLRYYKMHIYIYISQLITNIYFNRKTLNLINKKYQKQ